VVRSLDWSMSKVIGIRRIYPIEHTPQPRLGGISASLRQAAGNALAGAVQAGSTSDPMASQIFEAEQMSK